jgi:hypothetical protein
VFPGDAGYSAAAVVCAAVLVAALVASALFAISPGYFRFRRRIRGARPT